MAYLTIASFKLLSLMPPGRIDALETAQAGWLNAQLEAVSAEIDSRLRKRYNVPFSAPIPHAVESWLAAIVTVRAYLRHGADPTDPHFAEILALGTRADEQLKEAANSVEGLFDLPLRSDTTTSGLAKGMPWGSSDASPYAYIDEMRDDIA